MRTRSAASRHQRPVSKHATPTSPRRVPVITDHRHVRSDGYILARTTSTVVVAECDASIGMCPRGSTLTRHDIPLATPDRPPWKSTSSRGGKCRTYVIRDSTLANRTAARHISRSARCASASLFEARSARDGECEVCVVSILWERRDERHIVARASHRVRASPTF